jgi:hypothetical protein
MFRWTVLVLIAVFAWPVGEAAAVMCDAPSGKPMPCCEQAMEDCGTPGMTGDCCALVPGEKLPPAAASSELDPASVCRWHLASLAPVILPPPFVELEAIPVRAVASARAPHYAEPFFVRTSVLRI